MERNIRQVVVSFPVHDGLQKVNISTVYSYVENFGRIISCEESCNELTIRMIEARGASMHWVNRYHEIDGHRMFMRREMHILDMPLFCLKEICKRLLKDDLCRATEVCATLKDAATLAFEDKSFKSGVLVAVKDQMQTDVRILQCFRHSITRLEINVEDRQHFNYVFSSLKKMSPNVLKYLIFSGISYKKRMYSNLLTAELNDLFSVFPHLEGISFNTCNTMHYRFPFPPNLKKLFINVLYWENSSETFHQSINANLQKIVIRSRYCERVPFAELFVSNPQIKEISIKGWDWGICSTHHWLDEMVHYAPHLEVLSLYNWWTRPYPSVENIQTLKKMRNLKVLNLLLVQPVPTEVLNAIIELNVRVECLDMLCPRWDSEFCLNMSKFNHLKLLRVSFLRQFEGLVDVIGRLPQLSVFILKGCVMTYDKVKTVVSVCSKLTDFDICHTIDRGYDTKQYLGIVSIARNRPKKLQLRIYLGSRASTKIIDSNILLENRKYVDMVTRSFEIKSYPPYGFTV